MLTAASVHGSAGGDRLNSPPATFGATRAGPVHRPDYPGPPGVEPGVLSLDPAFSSSADADTLGISIPISNMSFKEKIKCFNDLSRFFICIAKHCRYMAARFLTFPFRVACAAKFNSHTCQ
jgi:hypothetical protein